MVHGWYTVTRSSTSISSLILFEGRVYFECEITPFCLLYVLFIRSLTRFYPIHDTSFCFVSSSSSLRVSLLTLQANQLVPSRGPPPPVKSDPDLLRWLRNVYKLPSRKIRLFYRSVPGTPSLHESTNSVHLLRAPRPLLTHSLPHHWCSRLSFTPTPATV